MIFKILTIIEAVLVSTSNNYILIIPDKFIMKFKKIIIFYLLILKAIFLGATEENQFQQKASFTDIENAPAPSLCLLTGSIYLFSFLTEETVSAVIQYEFEGEYLELCQINLPINKDVNINETVVCDMPLGGTCKIIVNDAEVIFLDLSIIKIEDESTAELSTGNFGTAYTNISISDSNFFGSIKESLGDLGALKFFSSMFLNTDLECAFSEILSNITRLQKTIYVNQDVGDDKFSGLQKLRSVLTGPKKTLRAAALESDNATLIVINSSIREYKIEQKLFRGKSITVTPSGDITIRPETNDDWYNVGFTDVVNENPDPENDPLNLKEEIYLHNFTIKE